MPSRSRKRFHHPGMNERLTMSDAFDSVVDRSISPAHSRNANTSSETLFAAISDVQRVLKELCMLVKVLMERVMMIPSTMSDANELERPCCLPLERNQQKRNSSPSPQSNLNTTFDTLTISMKLAKIEEKMNRVEALVNKDGKRSGTLRKVNSGNDTETRSKGGRKPSPGKDHNRISITQERRSRGRAKQKPPESALEDENQSDVMIKKENSDPRESQTKMPPKKTAAPSRVPSKKVTKKKPSGTRFNECSSPIDLVSPKKSTKEEHNNQSSTTIWYWYPCENSDDEQSETQLANQKKAKEERKVDKAPICKARIKDMDQDKKQKVIKSQVKSKGTRVMGEYERRLEERRNRREERRTLRRGRRMARAMSKFSHLVVGAAREMGYLPADISCCDRSSSSHYDLGYSGSSSESSYYSCSCSGSSCSCSCTSTEYSDSLNDDASMSSTSSSNEPENKTN